MRQVALLLFVLQFMSADAQKIGVANIAAEYKGNCRASFTKTKLEGENDTTAINKWLTSALENLKDPRCSIKLNYVTESPGGKHYSFTQLFLNIPVYQSEIKINVDKQNVVHSLFDNSYDTRIWNVDISAAEKNEDNIEYVIAIDPPRAQPVLAQRNIINHRLETLSANGRIIFQQNINCYFSQDSMVSGKVFNPDPLTSAQQFYDTTGTYVSHGDSDAVWLDAQEQIQNFRADFDSGHFSLRSPFVLLTNFGNAAPEVAPVTSTNGQFYYNRSQSGFQDVNAFYHISTYHNYVHGLGFNCADSLLAVDTHAFFDDNSYFTWDYSPCRIYYGTGGVPDAEDADVVVHEYCHFLSFTAAPHSNVGSERIALDEGFCDYNAASYSKSISTFNDEWVYNWDGHNQYWKGRVVNSNKVYPTQLDGSVYDNGGIWSSALFSLNADLGREVTDSLIIQTHYSYAANILMSDAAQLLIDADTLLFNGEHSCSIYNRLVEHGLIAQPNGCTSGISESNFTDIKFLQYGNSFTVISNSNSKVTLQILSITGSQIAQAITTQQAVFNYQNSNIAAGIYLVAVTGETGSAVFKWVNTGR